MSARPLCWMYFSKRKCVHNWNSEVLDNLRFVRMSLRIQKLGPQWFPPCVGMWKVVQHAEGQILRICVPVGGDVVVVVSLTPTLLINVICPTVHIWHPQLSGLTKKRIKPTTTTVHPSTVLSDRQCVDWSLVHIICSTRVANALEKYHRKYTFNLISN